MIQPNQPQGAGTTASSPNTAAGNSVTGATAGKSPGTSSMSSNSVPSKSPSTSNQTRTFSGGVTNVQGFERVASLAGGALLLSKGLRKGGIFGVLSLAMGAGALYRGISGHCELKEKLVNKSS